MSVYGGLFFICNILLGIFLTSHFFPSRRGLVKLAIAFFLGHMVWTTTILLLAFIFKESDDAIGLAMKVAIFSMCSFFAYLFFKKPKSVHLEVTRKDFVLLIVLFLGCFYIMNKSFSYGNNSFLIASNLYQDFGAHIPFIRSFSLGKNIPPEFPFFSDLPLIYHFFFYFLIGLYEKVGIRIDYAFNCISALALTGVMVLLYDFSFLLFKKKSIAVLTTVLFLTNSTLMFIDAFKKYWGNNLFSGLYHHATYLGDGPFGKSIISVFWNFNTYLNQRHFLFAIGLLLMFIIALQTLFINKVSSKSLIFFAILSGILPFWHTSVFIIIVLYCAVFLTVNYFQKKEWKHIFLFLCISLGIGLPQLFFMKSHQTISFSVINPGFLIAEKSSLLSFFHYWFFNLGISLFTIPAGIFLLRRKQVVLAVFIISLFFLPNIFQLGPQMFDNHKLFNVCILFGNIFTAFVLMWLWSRNIVFKFFSILFFCILILSGIIDALVIKNDVKAVIPDYSKASFARWLEKNTKPTDVFLADTEMFDPATISGRKSFITRPHYMWLYGINPNKRIIMKTLVLSGEVVDKVDYVVLQEYENKTKFKEYDDYEKVYDDKKNTVYRIK